MIKFKLSFDKDKMIQWLNSLAQKGYAMTGFFAGIFTFEKCEPGKYIYQIDFSEKFFRVTEGYREFMEEQDVEIVQCWGPWVYLRKEAAKGDFQMFTDIDSQIAHYTKRLIMFKIVTIIEIIGFMIEGFLALNGFPSAIAFMLIIAALIIAMLRVVVQLKKSIVGLKEQKGDFTKDWLFSRRNVSMLIPIGLLFNSSVLLLEDKIDHPIKLALQIIAILLMMVGIYQTAKKDREI